MSTAPEVTSRAVALAVQELRLPLVVGRPVRQVALRIELRM